MTASTATKNASTTFVVLTVYGTYGDTTYYIASDASYTTKLHEARRFSSAFEASEHVLRHFPRQQRECLAVAEKSGDEIVASFKASLKPSCTFCTAEIPCLIHVEAADAILGSPEARRFFLGEVPGEIDMSGPEVVS